MSKPMIVYVCKEYMHGGQISNIVKVVSTEESALAWMNDPERKDGREVCSCEVDGDVLEFY